MKKTSTSATLIAICCLLSISGYSQVSKTSGTDPLVFSCSTVIDPVYSPGLEGNLFGDPSTQPVGIILPPGYELYQKNRYPVVYFLHGIFQDAYGVLNKFLPLLDYLISNKIITPVIVVIPNGENYYGGSFYTNSYVSGNWQDFIREDVVQYIENNYPVLKHRDSRGLSGFSMGGYGSIKIAMKFPSVYGSMVLIDAACMDFDITINQGEGKMRKENIITAACKEAYSSGLPYEVRAAFSAAVAFAPDSTAESFCRFPYTCEGEFIDSIWQKWLMHDPISLLPSYQDSLRKLNSLQIYVADQGLPIGNESFHQELLDLGIEHGYEIYSGGHDLDPVLDEMLTHFSDHLTGIVPTIRLSSKYFLLRTDVLEVESDRNGEVFIVPKSEALSLESITDNQIYTDDLLVDEKNEYPLSSLDFGRYNIYAVCSDSIVSNIPGEFCVVPDTSRPLLNLNVRDDSIHVSCSRDGTIALLSCPAFGCPELSTVTEILHPPFLVVLIDSQTVHADQEVRFSTDNLSAGSYMLYGYDHYGIVSKVSVIQHTHIEDVRSYLTRIYPNPANDLLTIQTENITEYSIEISSLSAQLIFSIEARGSVQHLDLSPFRKGVYFITIRSKDFVTTKKIVKL